MRDDLVVPESAFPGRQGRLLWAFLVLNRRRPIGRFELAEAVWGDGAPEAWDNALNALVSKVRSAVRKVATAGSDIQLVSDTGRYELRLPSDAFIDLERARAAVHEAESLQLQHDPGGAWAESRVAIEIARRGLLPGEEAPWLESERRSVNELHLRALELTAEADLQRSQPEDAKTEARQLIRSDPLRESGYRLLMRALAATGNNAEIVRVMADWRRALSESGATPSTETAELYKRLTGAAERPAARATNPGVEATRTFLFADLRDYTQFIERHGDAAATSLIADYRRIVRAAMARTVGGEVKTEGDSFYLVFAAARQAITCGMNVLREAERHSLDHPDRPMRVGVGIHAGEPVPHEGQYVGATVVVAARLCQVADAGELLISDTVRALLRTSGLPPLEERIGLTLKGIADVPRIFAVDWQNAAGAMG